MSKGYIYAEFTVTNPDAWKIYLPLAQASLAEFGARYVVGNASELLEGDLKGRQLSVIEFDSVSIARDWYHSPQYQEAKSARAGAAELTAVLLPEAKI